MAAGVENVVRHNVILPDEPLIIAITTDEQLHPRVASNGVGLTNIMSKYQLLNQPEPVIRETDGQFVVTLPLIDPR